ncbi:phosphatase PAP2 family protein [Deinococcus ruber]|uniref:phosphatase PAP2 family protein n=1 Tax=Deinococcus ruber TaxID=1848197 RepID=UPI001E4960D7|nr:phosphatase PAP2 family protein [Deinococcus ruber]
MCLLTLGLPFDHPLAASIVDYQTPTGVVLASLLTNIGNPISVLIVGTIVAILLLKNHRALALFMVLNILLVSGMNEGIKQVVHRPVIRIHQFLQPTAQVFNTPLALPSPSLPRTVYSFPSGHAAGSAALLLGIGLLGWSTRWRWPVACGCCALALLVGLSRVYLDFHYLSDVLGGWALALACFSFLRLCFAARRLLR